MLAILSENASKTVFFIEIFYKGFVSKYVKIFDNNKKADNPIKMDKDLNRHYIKHDINWPIFL